MSTTVSGAPGGQRTSPATQVGRERRAEESSVSQPAAELFGHHRDFDGRGPRDAGVGRRAQLAPAGRGNRSIELGGALSVVERDNRLRAEAVDHLGGRVAQGDLLP